MTKSMMIWFGVLLGVCFALFFGIAAWWPAPQ
jgi:hypothetical protein